uniref:Uncharacterized protein n=1 Tax=Lactuca sativa TaxID=4236 RepID=A0A9R1XD22_LACSA|nr:hypothetical protein LSAT_V11C400182790 [Lactuca sativa]
MSHYRTWDFLYRKYSSCKWKYVHGCGLKFIHEPLLLHRKSTNLAELALIQCLSPSRVPGYAGNPLKDGGGRLRTAGSRSERLII